jgi:signal transduction histidine kinase
VNKYENIRLSIGATTIFKLFLIVGVVIISVVFVWYTLDVITQLKRDAERTVNSYVRLWQLAASENTSGGEIQVIFEEVIEKANFPVVITDPEGVPLIWRNVPGVVDNDRSPEVKQKVAKLARSLREDQRGIPLKYGDQIMSYFYYGNSAIIRQLQWMPFVEIGLVGLFILIGFIGFQNIRRSEERHIWVGMAKETAHQLGTPISSLMGWMEILSDSNPSEEQKNAGMSKLEILNQMKTDITRLQKVANRFGQIGSQPELSPTDLNTAMEETVAYFRKRLPFEGKGIDLVYNHGNIPKVKMNGELFSWAIENLIKNSLQAVNPQSGKIEIAAGMSSDNRYVVMRIKDNGKGIPAGIARKIFRPGFTTKKRGWGLGLTLVRRIVEDYHYGKISLVKSRPGETLFQIIMPVDEKYKISRWRRLYN